MNFLSYFVLRIAKLAIELIVAELIFCKKFRKRTFFPVRVIVGLLIFFMLVYPTAIVCVGIFEAFEFSNTIQVIVSFTVCGILFFLSLAILLFLFNETFKKIMLSGILGYCSQHLIFCIFSLIVIFVGQESILFYYEPLNMWTFLIYLLINGALYAVLWFLFAKRVRVWAMDNLGYSTYVLFGVLVIFNNIVGRAAETLYTQSSALYSLCLVCQVAICLFILFVQVFLIQQIKERNEKQLIEQLLYQKEAQYESIKNTT